MVEGGLCLRDIVKEKVAGFSNRLRMWEVERRVSNMKPRLWACPMVTGMERVQGEEGEGGKTKNSIFVMFRFRWQWATHVEMPAKRSEMWEGMAVENSGVERYSRV